MKTPLPFADTEPSRLFRSLSLVAVTLTTALETRLRLIAAEMRLEQARLLRTLILVSIGLGALVLALGTGIACIVLAVPPHHRVETLLGITFFLILLGALCVGVALRRQLKQWQPFTATREALKKDRECLASLNRN